MNTTRPSSPADTITPLSETKPKRRLLLLASTAFLLLALIIAGVVLLVPPASKPQIIGNISPEDVKAIERVAWNPLSERLLPNLSWDSFERAPAVIRNRIQSRTRIFEFESRDEVRVWYKVPEYSTLIGFRFIRKPAGWQYDDGVFKDSEQR